MGPRIAVAAAATAALTGVLIAAGGQYFIQDDFLSFSQAREYPFGRDYLGLAYFQHFAPGHRVLDWVLVHWFGSSWTASLAIFAGVWALGVAAFAWVLGQLVERRWLWAALVLLFASSPVWVRVFSWWASGGHVVPATAASALALAAALAWRRQRSRRMLVMLAAAYATALLFYSKALLVSAEIALVLWFVLAPSLRPRELLRTIVHDWPVLAVLVTISAGYLAFVLAGSYNEGSTGVRVDVWRAYLGLAWNRGVAPLLLGRTIPEDAGTFDDVVVVASQLTLLVLVVWSVTRRRDAWRAWVFLAVAFLLNTGLVGYGRLHDFGPDIGYDLRYNAEFSFLLPLTIALAVGKRDAEATPGRRPSSLAVAVGIVAAGLMALSLVSSYGEVRARWPDGLATRAYAQAVRASVDELDRRGIRVSLVDTAVPERVVVSVFDPFNRASRVLPTVDDRVAVDSSEPARRPAMLTDSGRVRVLELRTDRVLPGLACDPEQRTLELALELPATSRPRVAAFDLERASPGTEVWSYIDGGAGYTVLAGTVFTLPEGTAVAQLHLGSGAVRSVRLDIQPGGSACFAAGRLQSYTPPA